MSIETDDARFRTPAECHVNQTVRYPIPISLPFPDCFIALGQPTSVGDQRSEQ